MSRTVTIPLDTPLIGHGAPIKEIVLREPTFDEYMRIGEPTQIIFLGDSRYIVSELGPVIQDYVAVCLVEPKQPLLLEAGGLRVARAVKEGVLSFFRGDVSKESPSKTSPMTSSGNVEKGASAPLT